MTQFYISKNKDKIPFYFKYVSYKESTDIFEESQQLSLCKNLLNQGFSVYVEDSYLINKELRIELENLKAVFIKRENILEKIIAVEL